MAKQTIAGLEKRVQELQVANVEMVAGHQKLSKYIAELEARISGGEHADSMNRNALRAAETRIQVLVTKLTEAEKAHEMLLRKSLRAEGMAWEDIDRLLSEKDGRKDYTKMAGMEIRSGSDCRCPMCSNRAGRTF